MWRVEDKKSDLEMHHGNASRISSIVPQHSLKLLLMACGPISQHVGYCIRDIFIPKSQFHSIGEKKTENQIGCCSNEGILVTSGQRINK